MSTSTRDKSATAAEAVGYSPLNGAGEGEDVTTDSNLKHDNAKQTPSCRADIEDSVPEDGDAAQGARSPHLSVEGWRHSLSLWSLEALSCALAVAALLAIVGTIYPYQGKPNPQWPSTISLNTLLAIYTILLKSSMALVVGSSISRLQWIWFASERPLHDIVKYNAANDSAWGSFQWLWAHRFQQPLTSFGALITIVAIAIDPFTQQLLSYVDCSTVVKPSVATLPRTNYFKGHGIASGVNAEGGPIEVTIEPALQAAINAGIFGLPRTVVPDCSSGNCTFSQTYTTVGYCSKCEDISNSIAIVNETCYLRNSSTGQLGSSYFPQPCSAETNAAVITSELLNTNSITFQGPANLSVTWDDGPASNDNPGVAVMQIADSGLSSPSSYGFYWTQVLIGKTSYSVQHTNPDGSGPVTGCNSSAAKDLWSCRGYGAAQCTFQPCVREYSATVNVGKLQETLVNSTDPFLAWGYGDDEGTSLGAMALIDTYCTTAEENVQLAVQGYKLNTTRWLPYNVTAGYSQSPATAPFSQCIYAIDYLFADDLWASYLVEYFNGTVTANDFNEDFVVAEMAGPQPLQFMYNLGNIDYGQIEEIFRNISNSMTAFIRSAGEDGVSDPATGEVLHYATCLSVNWAWLALPAALVLSTVILFAWTMVATMGQPAWKDIALVMAFHGPWTPVSNGLVHGLTQGQAAKLHTEEGMEEVAKGVLVKLDRSGRFSRLLPAKSE